MRTREQQSPDLGVFEKTKFDQFTAGKKIVVNIDGDWKEVTLREEVTKDDVKNGKLNLKISYEKTPGNSVDLDLPVEAEPKIVKYTNGLHIQDADYGDFTIETSYVTENGSIEYNVKDNGENKTEVGVRQEIIDLWRSVNEAKQNVASLEAKIAGLSSQKKLEFTVELHKANKFVTEIFASLPEINKMNKLDNDQLTALQEKLAGLMKKSEQVLKSLSADVDLVITNTGATPATPTSSARRFEDFRHDDTEKDKAVREKELEKEYAKKPVAVCGVSDGRFGGARLVGVMLPIFRTLQMVALKNSVHFSTVDELFDEAGKIKDQSYQGKLKKMFDELNWYAAALKKAREKDL